MPKITKFLKTRVILFLNFTRLHAIAYTNKIVVYICYILESLSIGFLVGTKLADDMFDCRSNTKHNTGDHTQAIGLCVCDIEQSGRNSPV